MSSNSQNEHLMKIKRAFKKIRFVALFCFVLFCICNHSVLDASISFDLRLPGSKTQSSLKAILEDFETKRYALKKTCDCSAERDAHTAEFFYAFENLRQKYGEFFFQLDPESRDLEAQRAVAELIQDVQTFPIEQGTLPTGACTLASGATIAVDPLTGQAATARSVVYTADQKRVDCLFLLHSFLLSKPAIPAMTAGSSGLLPPPPIIDDLLYCDPKDNSSAPLGDTGMTIREGLWLILQAIRDDTATHKRVSFTTQQKLEAFIGALCDMATDYAANQDPRGVITPRKSTCVSGARKALSTCLKGMHDAFDEPQTVDQVALSQLHLQSIQVATKHGFESGLASRRIEGMANTQIAKVWGREYPLAELASFLDVLTLTRQIGYEELLATTDPLGKQYRRLDQFSLEVRLLAATSLMYTACEKLDPTRANSILDMSLYPSQPTCISINPDLGEYGPLATPGVLSLDDEAGKERALVYHARQILKAFGLCPGAPGTNLAEHLAMLARAVFHTPAPTDPACWEEVCLPASIDFHEVPMLKGGPISRLLMIEEDSTNPGTLDEIKALKMHLEKNAGPQTRKRLYTLLCWANNEALLAKLRNISKEQFQFPQAPDTPAGRLAPSHLKNIELIIQTMQEIIRSPSVSEDIKRAISSSLTWLNAKPNGYNRYNSAVYVVNKLPKYII